MKNFLKICLALVIGFIVISCEKDEDQAVLNETVKAKISSDKSTIVLSDATATETAINFAWTKSMFNIAVVSPQVVEFGIKGKDFKSSVTFNVVNNVTAGTLTHAGLNNLLLTLGAVTGQVNQIEARLKTSVGSASFYSNVLTLSITPYQKGPVYSFVDLYLIGSATAGGWDNLVGNAKIYPLQKTSTPNVYTYTGFFTAGAFKLIKTPGSWDTQYGLGGSSGQLIAGGGSGDIPVSGAGYYKLTVDISALTYAFTTVTPPTLTYTSISLIGSASGDWNTDVDMQQSTFDPHVWVKKNVKLSTGEFKFRANHDWATSWGVAQEFFGIAAIGGGNIPLTTTFQYDVYFNDVTGDFSVIPVI